MKKYVGLSIDCTALKEEMTTVIETDMIISATHWTWLGNPLRWPTVEPKLPSLQSTFTSLNVTSDGIGKSVIGESSLNMPLVFPVSHAIVPLASEPCTITFFEPDTGINKIFDWCYQIESCTFVETIPLSGPILVGAEVPYLINTVDPNKTSSVMVVRFATTDIDSLLA